MKKLMQLATTILLLTSLGAQAEVRFELTNKSSQPIWICGYADEDLFTGESSNDAEKKLSPNDSFSTNIGNGEVELTVSLIEPGKRGGHNEYRTYRTNTSSNNKNKILIWDHTKSQKTPLYPATDKRLMGLIKTSITNNIRQTELQLTSYKNL